MKKIEFEEIGKIIKENFNKQQNYTKYVSEDTEDYLDLLEIAESNCVGKTDGNKEIRALLVDNGCTLNSNNYAEVEITEIYTFDNNGNIIDTEYYI